MKKTILLSSIFAVGAALATEINSSVIGTLPVEVAEGQQLMAVPFADNANGEIAVSDMVKTSDLEAGTKLYVATSSGYDMWTLDEDGTWKAAKKVTIGDNGKAIEDESQNATKATVKRGDAFWLETLEGKSGKVTLLGGKSEATPAVAVANKWNLISNPTIAKAVLTEKTFVTGDKIAVPQGGKLVTYSWKENYGWWIRKDGKILKNQTVEIDAGKGIWFFANGTNREIAW